MNGKNSVGPLTKELLESDYCLFKTLAFKHFQEGNSAKALDLIVLASRIGYEFNFISSFGDDELDKLLKDISFSELTFAPEDVKITNRIVFYDYFAWQNRGLTQQYLYALIDLQYEILYIVPNHGSLNESNEIFQKIKECPKADYLVLHNELGLLDKSQRILDAIKEFKPSSAFLHLAPWDVVASLVFIQVENKIHRYFINLTDHAYWLGKNLIDTSLEFRNFGYQLSKICRGISEEKLQLCPYYPILQAEGSFQGLPFSLENKIIGISAGSGYKYLGEDGKFYELIHSLLKRHKNFVFILVGAGRATNFFKRQIAKDGLEEQFFLLEARNDIYQLLKRCDIYIGSFPIAGGLMSQIAAVANLAILVFNKPEYYFNDITDLIPKHKNGFKEFVTETEFLTICDKLIVDKEFRKEYQLLTVSGTITPEEFKINLNSILNSKSSLPFNFIQINNLVGIERTSQHLLNLFLEIENNIDSSYSNLLISHRADTLVTQSEDIKIRLKRYRGINQSSHFNLKKLVKTVLRKIAHKCKQYILNIFSHILFIVISSNEFKKLAIDPQKISFKKFGDNSILPEERIILNPQYITIGCNFFSLNNLRLEAIDAWAGQYFLPQIVIGNNVSINTDVHIGAINKILIEDNVLIASRVYISDHSHGDISKEALKVSPSQRPLISKGPVIIGKNAWIGEGVCIMPGVVIGQNSIIGANSVVTKSMPPNSVVAGVPAKVIRMLI